MKTKVSKKFAGASVVALVALSLPLFARSAQASCNNCIAHWAIQAQSGGQSGIRYNTSDNTLASQDFHGSLIDGCAYEGNQLFNMSHYYDNTASTPQWGTPQFDKASLLWAGGHHWFDGATNYNVTTADTTYGC